MNIRNALLSSFNVIKNLNTTRQIALVLVSAGIVIGGAVLFNMAGRGDYQTLFQELSPADLRAVQTKLEQLRYPYLLDDGGGGLSVPSGKIYEIRMALASEGLPQEDAAGFELFDNTRLGMTDFTQNVNYQRAIQGELARTISQFKEVSTARIHIVMPADSLFLEKERPASASVVLMVKPGRKLSTEQVRGIVHLVSSSVSGLKPDQITVVDNNGNMLAGFNRQNTLEKISSHQLVLKEQVAQRLEQRIKTMLENALGPGRAIVRIACDLDFVQHEETEEIFLPDNQVVRSEQALMESAAGAGAKGIPGVTTRTNPSAQTGAGGSPGREKQNRTVNYEIGKRVRHTTGPVGNIKQISAAVLVDGIYEKIPVKTRKSNKDEPDFEMRYVARTAEEMEKLTSIVKSAINYNSDRGDVVEVVNIPFEKPIPMEIDPEPDKPEWMRKVEPYRPILRYLVIAVIALAGFFLVVRPLIRWLTSQSTAGGEIIPQLPMTVGEAEDKMAATMKNLTQTDKITHMLSDKESLELLRSWMKQS